MHKSILFLDIDGVLNNTAWMQVPRPRLTCDPENIRALNLFTARSSAEIVIISEWRRLMPWDHLCCRLRGLGVEAALLDKTPCLSEGGALEPRGGRGWEVDSWLRTSGFGGGYIILDDRRDHHPHLHRLLQVDPDTGFHESRVEEALQLLQRRSEAVKPPSLSWKDHEL